MKRSEHGPKEAKAHVDGPGAPKPVKESVRFSKSKEAVEKFKSIIRRKIIVKH